jgi:transcriptional regulator with XRE-family HTH domain
MTVLTRNQRGNIGTRIPIVERENPSSFANTLKRFRKQEKLTQYRLAKLARLDHSIVSRFESGDREPSRTSIHQLAKALRLGDLDTDRLLFAAGFAPEKSPIANAVKLMLESLTRGNDVAVIAESGMIPTLYIDAKARKTS